MTKKKNQEPEMVNIPLMDMGIQCVDGYHISMVFPSQDCKYLGVLTVTPRRAVQLAEFILSQVNKLWPMSEEDECGCCCPHCSGDCEDEDEEEE